MGRAGAFLLELRSLSALDVDAYRFEVRQFLTPSMAEIGDECVDVLEAGKRLHAVYENESWLCPFHQNVEGLLRRFGNRERS